MHWCNAQNKVVPDKFNKGYPIVHLISNRGDELVLIPFFQAIKERCSNPNLEINVVMTDVDNFGWNAFSRVFGDCTQLLCKQHVKRAWINKIPLCWSQQLQEELYQTSEVILQKETSIEIFLEVILEETSIAIFEKMLVRFLREYENFAQKFVNYFASIYVSKPVKWVLCYRQFEHANTDINMITQSFHSKLKTFYLERMSNKRIDDLVNVLLEIEADDYSSYIRSNIRYEKGIPDAHLTALSNKKWSL